jgi:hypothetical protein
MATPRSSLDAPAKKPATAAKSVGVPRPVLIAGLALIIVSALGWTIYISTGGPSDVVITSTREADTVQATVAKAVLTEQNKWKFSSITIAPSEDGKKVVVSGTVKTKADMDELTKLVDGNKGGFPVEMAVKIGG